MTKERALFILHQRCKNNTEAEEALEFLKKSVTQKYGEWIITYPHGKHNPIYECPCCHASNSSVFKNFCPNCGVDMRGEK